MVEEFAEKRRVTQRKRKFRGQSLRRMIVLTLLKKPEATFEDRALTVVGHKGADGRAVGGPVSATAVEKRFTPPLVDFLRDVLSLSLPQGVAAEPVSVALLERFTAVFIGDSSSIALPDELQQEFSSCGGTEGSGWTAWKIQVRWNLKTGERPLVLIEAGRASDAKSPIAQQEVQPGALEIFDLGDFSLDRFRRWDAGQASYISRLPHGTTVLDELGQVLNLRDFLSAPAVGNVVEVPVLLGINDRLPSRLIAVRVPEEVAHRRRQKGREKAAKNGRGPAAEDWVLWGWSLFVTNLPLEPLTWKEDVVPYRARWQIELLFKRCPVPFPRGAQSPRPPSSGSHSRRSAGGVVGEAAGRTVATRAVAVGVLAGRPPQPAPSRPRPARLDQHARRSLRSP